MINLHKQCASLLLVIDEVLKLENQIEQIDVQKPFRKVRCRCGEIRLALVLEEENVICDCLRK